MLLSARDLAIAVNRRGGGRTCADVGRRNVLVRVKKKEEE